MEHIEESNENKVLQNSDILFKSETKWRDDITPTEITEYEINMLKHTKNINDILEEERKESEKVSLKTVDEQTKDKIKHILTMIKVIACNRLGYNPLYNVSLLQPYDAKKLKKLMEELVNDINNGKEKELSEEFNDICNLKLFNCGSDVSLFPVYK
jgi:hypothetical protein